MITRMTRRNFARLAALLAASGIGLHDASAEAPPAAPDKPAAQPAGWSDGDAKIPVTSDDPMWGDRAAPVTLVVFGNYQCPFTRKLTETVEDLKRKFGPKKLRVVWKHNPLDMHQRAKPAAIAAEVVRAKGGSRAFFTWTKLAFDNQKDLSDPNFAIWAQQAGVQQKIFVDALSKASIASKVDRDLAEAKGAGVRGTPASFVNGVSITGSQSVDKFAEVVDDELVKAASLKVKPERVYVERCNANVALAAATPKPPAKKPPPPINRNPSDRKSGG